jgi:predicted nucleic acid-binding Zn ribbon protein
MDDENSIKNEELRDLSQTIILKDHKKQSHLRLVNELRRKNYDPFRNVKYFKKRKVAPESVTSVLNFALKKNKLEDKLTPFKFLSNWPQIVGTHIAKHSKPDNFKDGILFIKVDSSVWLQELMFQKETILRRLQAITPKELELRDIFFAVK